MARMDEMDQGPSPSTDVRNKENVTGGLTAATNSIGGNNNKKLEATENTETPPVKITARNPFEDGPTPKKGSGQDRFREMIMADPKTGMPTSGIFAHHAMPPQLRATSTSVAPHSSGQSPILSPSAMYPLTPAVGGLPSMPPPPRAQPRVPAVGRNLGSGRGGSANSMPKTSTALLGLECQKRHFNPAYDEWQTTDGRFMCTVHVNGTTVTDGHSFSTPADAKRAIAQLAIAEVQKMPLSTRDRHAGAVPAPPPPPMANVTGHPTASRHGHDNQAHYYTPDPQEVQRVEASQLISQIQILYKLPPHTPSAYIFSDPLASRAFLEGFSLGARLNDTATSQRHGSNVEPVQGQGQAQARRPRSPQAVIDRLYNGRFQRDVREHSPMAPRGRPQHRERSPDRRRPSFGGGGGGRY